MGICFISEDEGVVVEFVIGYFNDPFFLFNNKRPSFIRTFLTFYVYLDLLSNLDLGDMILSKW